MKPDDVDFCYGSRDGLLWPVLDRIFKLNLKYENTSEAIQQRQDFLKSRNIGICDIVESSRREKIDASDLGMQKVELRDMLQILRKYPKIDTLLFTGGNSKNGPEYFFRKHIKDYNLKLEVVSNEVPRIHQFVISSKVMESTQEARTIKTVSLTSGSGAANISISKLPLYKHLKAKNPKFNTFDFRVMQYSEFF